MEHRWGRRIPMRVPVRLTADSSGPVPGETEDISISGAFVRTTRALPLGGRLEVEILIPGRRGREPELIAAHVTRRTRDGVGIEWCELAPRAVLALLQTTDPLAARRARPESSRGVRPPCELHLRAEIRVRGPESGCGR